MSAVALPADGTIVLAKRSGPLPGQTSMPGVRAGTRAIVRHASPAGTSNVQHGMVWLELEEPIIWSFGVSTANGYWASPSEFEVVTDE